MILFSLLLAQAPLEIWHSYHGNEAVALQRIADADAAELGTHVHLTEIPYDNFQNKLLQALAADQGPDLFIAPHERVAEWQRYLQRVPEAGDIATATQALQWNGENVGLPFALKTLALVTHGERVDNLEALQSKGLGLDVTSFYYAAPFFFAREPALFRDGALTIADPPALEAFTWLRQASRTPGFVPRDLDHAQLVAAFKRNEIAALLDGPWVLSEISDTQHIAVQTLPAYQGFSPRPFLTVDAIFVPKSADASALPLAKLLASAAHCGERISVGRQIPPYRACLEALHGEDARLLTPFFIQAETAVPMPTAREMSAAWDPLRHFMSALVHTDEPLLQAAKEAINEHHAALQPEHKAPWWLNVAALLGVIALALRFRNKRAAEPKNTRALWFLAPAVAFTVPLLFVPLLFGAALSVLSFHDGAFSFVGVGNFLTLLSDVNFYKTLAVTVLWTVANLTVHVFLGVALALLLDRPRLRFRGLFRVLLILPWAVPNYISALVFHQMFASQAGAVNQILFLVGVPRVDWFGHFASAFTANLTANSWLGFPFIMVVTLGALQQVPHELKDAMALDGATRWQTFRFLTWPTITPLLQPALILSAIWTFNMFNIIYLVSGGEPRGKTEILISEAYRWAFERGARYGYAAAYCVTICGFLALFEFLRARASAPSAPA